MIACTVTRSLSRCALSLPVLSPLLLCCCWPVVEARDLAAADPNGYSDPYVKIKLHDGTKEKSHTIQKVRRLQHSTARRTLSLSQEQQTDAAHAVTIAPARTELSRALT